MDFKKIITAICITVVCGAITASAKNIIDVAVLQTEVESIINIMKRIESKVDSILINQGERR